MGRTRTIECGNCKYYGEPKRRFSYCKLVYLENKLLDSKFVMNIGEIVYSNKKVCSCYEPYK